MDLPLEKIRQYWNNLKLCAYTDIMLMDEIDVRKIFMKDNRLDFLIWALLKLTPDYKSRFDMGRMKSRQKLESIVADLLYFNGFCKASEKQSFVTESTLPMKQELAIFDRIFKLLVVKQKEKIERENFTSTMESMRYVLSHPSKEGFERVIFCDDNIFPNEKPYKKLNDKERQEKIEYFKMNIAELNSGIIEAEKEKEDLLKSFDNIDCDNVSTENIECLIMKLTEATKLFHEGFPEYQINMSKLSDLSKITPKTSKMGPVIEKSSNNFDLISKFLKSQSYLQNYEDTENLEDSGNLTSEDNSNNFSDFIIDSFAISKEIVTEERIKTANSDKL